MLCAKIILIEERIMIHLIKYKIAYVPVPKNACTSVKSFLYRLQNNREFQVFEAGHKKFHIHNVMPTKCYEQWSSTNTFSGVDKSNTFIFAVVRDPLSRLLSCYKNRVLFHNDIGKDKQAYKLCQQTGLSEKPDINTFVKNLDFYQRCCPSIQHHSRPQVDYLGHNLNFYSKIYPTDKINSELWNDLSDIVGESIPAPKIKLQTGGSQKNIDELTSENSLKIKRLYAADYKFIEVVLK